MVWYVDRTIMNKLGQAVCAKYTVCTDRLWQSVNIMFNLSQNSFDIDDIYQLIRSGVNIFNIDRTQQDEELYTQLKKAMDEAIKMPIMYPPQYYRPITLSITMSVNEPIEIDERVDIVILKDVLHVNQVTQYKTEHMKTLMPILLWLSGDCHEELLDLIQVSDGIVFEFPDFSQAMSPQIAYLCKKHEKPVFYSKTNVFEEIELSNSKLKMLAVASEIVTCLMDGVVVSVYHTAIEEWKDIVIDVVEALDVVEKSRDLESWHNRLRKRTLSPQILPVTIMIATLVAALKSQAAAILLLTATGRSARMLSNMSPPCPILAITAHKSTVRRLHLLRKVIPLFYEGRRAVNWREECRNRALFGSDFALKTGLFCGGAKLVVLSRSEEGAAWCNEFQIVIAPL